MATILRSEKREFQESPDKIDNYRIFTGAHQLYNHTTELCFYLDIRTFFE